MKLKLSAIQLNKSDFAGAFFTFTLLYQYLARVFYISHKGEFSPLYMVLSPYVYLPLIALLLCLNVRQVSLKLIMILLCFFLGDLYCLANYSQFPQFPLNFIKNLQYFWGISLVITNSFLILQSVASHVSPQKVAITFVKLTILAIFCVTFAEFVAFNVLRLPFANFYLDNVDISNNQLRGGFLVFRPLGITSYSQPNGLIAASLVALRYFQCKKMLDKYIALALVTVFLTLSGTGYLALILMLSLLPKKLGRTAIVFAAVLPLGLLAVTVFAASDGILSKLSFEYFEFLIKRIFEMGSVVLSNFSTQNYLFGSDKPNFNIATGITHDWAYIDVFYEQGVVGVVLYLIIYGYILYLSLDQATQTSKKVVFALYMLILNIHYPTLNFYVGQMLFGILAALTLQHEKLGLRSREQMKVSVLSEVPINHHYNPVIGK